MRLYLALRANGLGTYNKDEGYLLDFRYGDVGYNMRALDAYSVALGLPLGGPGSFGVWNFDGCAMMPT